MFQVETLLDMVASVWVSSTRNTTNLYDGRV
jgi:hypothetical protein